MAVSSLAKKFEERFKKDFQDTVKESFVYRLNDQMSEYKEVSKNISDYICYSFPNMFLAEIKTHKGASIPFEAIPQYDRLITASGIKGIRSGVIVWLYEKDIVFYVPASTIKKMKDDGEKSVGIRHFDKYRIVQIPSKKLRTFMESDYSVLLELKEGE